MIFYIEKSVLKMFGKNFLNILERKIKFLFLKK